MFTDYGRQFSILFWWSTFFQRDMLLYNIVKGMTSVCNVGCCEKIVQQKVEFWQDRSVPGHLHAEADPDRNISSCDFKFYGGKRLTSHSGPAFLRIEHKVAIVNSQLSNNHVKFKRRMLCYLINRWVFYCYCRPVFRYSNRSGMCVCVCVCDSLYVWTITFQLY